MSTRIRSRARTATRRRTNRSPYAGGSVAGNVGSFLHNAYHVPGALGDQAAGDVMLITNEANEHGLRDRRQVPHRLAEGHARRRRQRRDAAGSGTMARLASYSTLGKPGEFIDDRAAGTPRHRRLLGALVHRQRQHRRARQLRAGHAVRGHHRSAQPEAGRLLPRPGTGHARHAPARSSRATWPGPTGTASTSTSRTTRAASTCIKFHGVSGNTQPKTCWNSCADDQTMQVAEDTPGGAGGTVPATLSLDARRQRHLRRVHAWRREGLHRLDLGQRHLLRG